MEIKNASINDLKKYGFRYRFFQFVIQSKDMETT